MSPIAMSPIAMSPIAVVALAVVIALALLGYRYALGIVFGRSVAGWRLMKLTAKAARPRTGKLAVGP